MGDVPPSSTSAGEFASLGTPNGGFQGLIPSEGQSVYQHGPGQVDTSAFQHYQQPYMTMPNPFTNQYDMTHAPPSGRQGSFNMTAMTNSLPQHTYRPNYGSGQHQQRHGTGALAHGVVQQMAPYGLHAYYMPQHQHMSPYYNTHMSAPQHQPQQPNPRQNEFYPNPVIMNQPHSPMPASYYYTPTHPYPNPNPSMHGQMTPSHFLIPDGTSPGAPKQSSLPGVGPSVEFPVFSQPESMLYLSAAYSRAF